LFVRTCHNVNPPFNDSDWRGDLLKDDKRWKYGTPPTGNANYTWVQHFIRHLAPTGLAGFVLTNGGLPSNQSVITAQIVRTRILSWNKPKSSNRCAETNWQRL
jgi:type I restriction-modification system DNA methylase subunit